MVKMPSIPNLDPASEPGPEIYAAVRGTLIARGDSLNRWCKRHAITREWARQALLGEATGPAARRLVRQLIQAAATGDDALH